MKAFDLAITDPDKNDPVEVVCTAYSDNLTASVVAVSGPMADTAQVSLMLDPGVNVITLGRLLNLSVTSATGTDSVIPPGALYPDIIRPERIGLKRKFTRPVVRISAEGIPGEEAGETPDQEAGEVEKEASVDLADGTITKIDSAQ
jgi:hypothetical protein